MKQGSKYWRFCPSPHFALISLRLVITHDDTLKAEHGKAKMKKKNILSNVFMLGLLEDVLFKAKDPFQAMDQHSRFPLVEVIL